MTVEGAEHVVVVLQTVVVSSIVAILGVFVRVEIFDVFGMVSWLVVDGLIMGVGRIFVSDVTVRLVDGDLVLVVWVLGGWECSFVVLNWEKVTELELVEGKLRNGGIAVDNSLVTLSSNIGAVQPRWLRMAVCLVSGKNENK